MPTHTCPIAEHNALFAQCFGEISHDDLIDWNLDARVQPDGENRLTTIVDLSEVTGTLLAFDNMNAICSKLIRHYEKTETKLHLVLFAPDDMTFGMSRILQSLSASSKNLDIEVFRSPQNLNGYLQVQTLHLDRLRDRLGKS